MSRDSRGLAGYPLLLEVAAGSLIWLHSAGSSAGVAGAGVDRLDLFLQQGGLLAW